VGVGGSGWEQVGMVVDVLEHRQDDSDFASKPPEPITYRSGDGLVRPGPPSHVTAGLERVLGQAHVAADKETPATMTTAMTTTAAANRRDSSTCSNTAEPARASTWAATVGTWVPGHLGSWVGRYFRTGRPAPHWPLPRLPARRWQWSSREMRRCGQDCDMGRSPRRPRPGGARSLEQ
jgi:hypothetical protein